MESIVRAAEAAVALAVIALLARIAWHLGRLRAQLAELPARMSLAERPKDSPTINVNLAGLPVGEAGARGAAAGTPAQAFALAPAGGGAGTAASRGPAPSPGGQTEAPGARSGPGGNRAGPKDAGADAGADDEPREDPRIRRVQTLSGVKAIECPRCKSENSSYRIECYNCGASLV